MFNKPSLPYLAVVQNTARLVYLRKKLACASCQEPQYDLLSEYIKLMTWFEGLGMGGGVPVTCKSFSTEN